MGMLPWESSPTLGSDLDGYPILDVPWSDGRGVRIAVSESPDGGGANIDIESSVPIVRFTYNGEDV